MMGAKVLPGRKVWRRWVTGALGFNEKEGWGRMFDEGSPFPREKKKKY